MELQRLLECHVDREFSDDLDILRLFCIIHGCHSFFYIVSVNVIGNISEHFSSLCYPVIEIYRIIYSQAEPHMQENRLLSMTNT